MIEIQNLVKRFGQLQVLDEVNLTVAQGEVLVVCGPSGSGKSTLIKCINGLEAFDSGDVLVEGISVVDKQRRPLTELRKRVGMVFQHFELYPHLTVCENICLAQRVVLRRSRDEALKRTRGLLERVGLASKEDMYPAKLSGGQQQRTAIARALALDPVIMLFDEPTSALDPEMINEVLDVMTTLAHSDGMTMIVVTHEMGFARRAANTVVFMDEGKIVERNASDAFFTAPQTDRARAFLSKILSH
jgi:glutamate/aspartate transport system ATP-binding protein